MSMDRTDKGVWPWIFVLLLVIAVGAGLAELLDPVTSDRVFLILMTVQMIGLFIYAVRERHGGRPFRKVELIVGIMFVLSAGLWASHLGLW